MEVLAELGRDGGIVLRSLTLFGEQYIPQAEIDGETLMKLPPRNRRALRDSGMMRFFDSPRPTVNPFHKDIET